MKVYISGPISGRPLDVARAEFAAAAEALRALGHDPVDPFEVAPTDYGKTWQDYMRADIKALLDCDAVVVLPGWDRSRGARIEATLASAIGLTVLELAVWLEQEATA